jgi:hypothetical protein
MRSVAAKLRARRVSRRTWTKSERWLVIACAFAVASCYVNRRGVAQVPPGPRRLGAVTLEERAAYVRRAQVWHEIDTASLDLLAGPPGDDAFAFEQNVTCDYVYEPIRYGDTPKFFCRLGSGDVVKVKYGRDNPEVYAEVAGTRLFWALGFGADRQYPARVTCRDCPGDPWKRRQPEKGAINTFDPAIIERDVKGKAIEVRGVHKGWDWSELDSVDEREGGAPRAQLDALKLLAVFVQHSDNKDEQQRLACLPGAARQDAEGDQICQQVFLFTVDLGCTFARASYLNSKKFQLHHWSAVPIWKDPGKCMARLKRSRTGTLIDPRISEAGRAFLAERLVQLSDRQIRDLFVAARAERVGELIRDPDGRKRAVTVDDWVQAFVRRRAEIVDHRCPE